MLSLHIVCALAVIGGDFATNVVLIQGTFDLIQGTFDLIQGTFDRRGLYAR
jgi:hypothetical protein